MDRCDWCGGHIDPNDETWDDNGTLMHEWCMLRSVEEQTRDNKDEQRKISKLQYGR